VCGGNVNRNPDGTQSSQVLRSSNIVVIDAFVVILFFGISFVGKAYMLLISSVARRLVLMLRLWEREASVHFILGYLTTLLTLYFMTMIRLMNDCLTVHKLK